ncbi:MAG: transposase [Saprospiraceae bacterium]|nr:transposase [Saprospiraceae bacterium]
MARHKIHRHKERTLCQAKKPTEMKRKGNINKTEEVAYIYKLRWNIELLFKKLKFIFYSETENGIKTQIWCTLIAQYCSWY